MLTFYYKCSCFDKVYGECVRILILRYIKSERFESFTARDYLKVKGLKMF